MKRVIAFLLSFVLMVSYSPISVNAKGAQFVNITIEHNNVNTIFSVIESGDDLLFSGEDLAALGGFEYRIDGNNAYFTRGIKVLRVDIKKSRLHPFEEHLKVGERTFTEKVQQIDGVYYFSGAEMLPWLNVNCNLIDGKLDIDTDAFSIWELVPAFNPDNYAFDFINCCKELGVSSKYVEVAAYMRGKGITGVFWDLIPSLGNYVNYCELFDDVMLDQSSAKEAVEELTDFSDGASYWTELVSDSNLKDYYPEDMKLLGRYSKILSGISLGAEVSLYLHAFGQHNKNILDALFSMEVNTIYHDLPGEVRAALVETRENYTDVWAGLEQKLVMGVGDGLIEELAGQATGPFGIALSLTELSEVTGPDWAEGINRINDYEMIAEYCLDVYQKMIKHSSRGDVGHIRGLAYMYLYACEQNWTAMAQYAAEHGNTDLQNKYESIADAAEEWQGKFMTVSSAQENDSHEYGDATGDMKQGYTDALLACFSEVFRQPDTTEQENHFTDFLQTHPEYNYYAFLDLNDDGVLEMLATEKLDDRNGAFLSMGENVDLYICKDGVIKLAYENIRSKYTYLAYDAANQRLVSSIGGSGGSGISYISLDKSLTIQETSFESYCFRVDENGNEIWTKYYNGVEVNDETRQKYENLYSSWKTSSCENIAFHAVPKAALIGEWNLYPAGVPHEDGYWVDVWLSSLNLNADGTVSIALGVVQSEGYAGYSGTWQALPERDNEFILQFNITGGVYSYFEEGFDEERDHNLSIRAKLEGDRLVLEKISGDDIYLYYAEAYERDLEFETWVERQGLVQNHITYNTLLLQYSEAAEYTLYDIDKDGCKELIIHESLLYDSGYHVYTQDNIGVRRCGDYYWSYSDCLYAYDGNGLVVHDGGTGSLHLEYVTLYSLSNGTLEEEKNLFDTEWHTTDELQSYLSRYTPIENFISVTDESMLDSQ